MIVINSYLVEQHHQEPFVALVFIVKPSNNLPPEFSHFAMSSYVRTFVDLFVSLSIYLCVCLTACACACVRDPRMEIGGSYKY